MLLSVHERLLTNWSWGWRPEGRSSPIHAHYSLPRRLRCRSRNQASSGCRTKMTRVSLGLGDNFADGIIAKRIVELAKAGERNPDLLSEGSLEKLRGHLYGD